MTAGCGSGTTAHPVIKVLSKHFLGGPCDINAVSYILLQTTRWVLTLWDYYFLFWIDWVWLNWSLALLRAIRLWTVLMQWLMKNFNISLKNYIDLRWSEVPDFVQISILFVASSEVLHRTGSAGIHVISCQINNYDRICTSWCSSYAMMIWEMISHHMAFAWMTCKWVCVCWLERWDVLSSPILSWLRLDVEVFFH